MKKNILFIGAGRLGTTFAKALSQSGYSIPFFYSTEFPEEKEVHLPGTMFIKELIKVNFHNIDVVIITVPDAQIKNVVEQLELLNINWPKKLVIHTSGCLSSTEINTLKLKGAWVGSIHPMQTFDAHFLPKVIFENIIFSVEGDNQIIDFISQVAELLTVKIIKLKPEDKILYHIAAVASSNFFVALLDYISELYKKLEFDDSKIKELILPIVNQTLTNFNNDEAKTVLTGPLKRGDLSTIENHVNYLKENKKEMLPIYNEISKYISRFILKQNESEAEKLNRILNND